MATKKPKPKKTIKPASTKLISSKVMLLIFVLITAVVGTIMLVMSNAQVQVDMTESNRKAFEAIQADRVTKGQAKISISKDKVPSKPDDGSTISEVNSRISVANYNKREKALAYAEKRVGYKGERFFDARAFGRPFGESVTSWAWCSSFVSKALKEGNAAFWWGKYGGSPNGWQIPLVADVQRGMYYLGVLRDKNSYTPKRGDIAFFSWSGGGYDHIGLIYKVDSANIYTIEGNVNGNGTNRGNVVAKKVRSRTTGGIIAYGNWFGN